MNTYGNLKISDGCKTVHLKYVSAISNDLKLSVTVNIPQYLLVNYILSAEKAFIFPTSDYRFS